jgi:hypothetical protein
VLGFERTWNGYKACVGMKAGGGKRILKRSEGKAFFSSKLCVDLMSFMCGREDIFRENL